MLTWAVLPKERSTGRGSCWPDYRLEHQDWGAHERPETLNWSPTPRHIDEAQRVQEYLGGIEKWKYVLLTLRASQEIFGKASWRGIEFTMRGMAHSPTYSHTKWKQVHDELIEKAYTAALHRGDVIF